MIAYLVNQIIIGNLTYLQVVTAKPQYQAAIDKYIADNNIEIDKSV